MTSRLPLLALAALVACDGPAPPPDAAPDGARCRDDRTIERCAAGACEEETCREDALCVDAACLPWETAPLSADFRLTYSDEVERRVLVRVLPGGFPRAQVQALRFDFGDGVAGWGETLSHDYAAPGVYSVRLEVRLTGHRTLVAERAAVVAPGPDHAPLFLTVDEVPAALNGSAPFTRHAGTPDDPTDDPEEAFRLAVPPFGFTVDATLADDPDDPVDRPSLSLVADRPLGAAAPGDELVARLRLEGAEIARGSFEVALDDAIPEGDVTFTLSGRTASGRELASAITVTVVPFGPDRQPFDRPMVWLFRPSLDFFTTSAVAPGSLELSSVEGPDGQPDLAQELRVIGAQGDDPDLDAAYLGWILEALRAETYRYFGVAPDGTPLDGIPLTIVYEGEEGAPDPADFDPNGTFSMMRFGGVFDGFLGFSGFAPYNERRIDDSRPDRGVATAGMIGILATTPVIARALDPIAPGVGQPIGAHPADAAVLAPGYDPLAETDPERRARYDALRGIARQLALALASVTAHEMGHAMGLMPDGPPPSGFFGGEADASVVVAARTNSHHADLPGLNLMQAGGDYLGVIDEAVESLELPRGADLLALAEILALENRLSAYSRAYLQGRLTYLDFDGAPSGYAIGCGRITTRAWRRGAPAMRRLAPAGARVGAPPRGSGRDRLGSSASPADGAAR